MLRFTRFSLVKVSLGPTELQRGQGLQIFVQQKLSSHSAHTLKRLDILVHVHELRGVSKYLPPEYDSISASGF